MDISHSEELGPIHKKKQQKAKSQDRAALLKQSNALRNEGGDLGMKLGGGDGRKGLCTQVV